MDYIKLLKTMLAAAGGTLVYWLGGLDQLLAALLALIVLDYITGIIKSWHQGTLSSAVGFRGIAKKVMILGVVAMSFVIQKLTMGAMPVREITIVFFIGNEGISILENAAQIGLPLPAALRKALVQLSKEQE